MSNFEPFRSNCNTVCIFVGSQTQIYWWYNTFIERITSMKKIRQDMSLKIRSIEYFLHNSNRFAAYSQTLYTCTMSIAYPETKKIFNMPVRINEYLLGTPETSLRGLSTLKVLRVDRSTEPSPSWLAGIMYGKNLKYNIIFFCTEKSR